METAKQNNKNPMNLLSTRNSNVFNSAFDYITENDNLFEEISNLQFSENNLPPLNILIIQVI